MLPAAEMTRLPVAQTKPRAETRGNISEAELFFNCRKFNS
jgi:hypothetical protein